MDEAAEDTQLMRGFRMSSGDAGRVAPGLCLRCGALCLELGALNPKREAYQRSGHCRLVDLSKCLKAFGLRSLLPMWIGRLSSVPAGLDAV